MHGKNETIKIRKTRRNLIPPSTLLLQQRRHTRHQNNINRNNTRTRLEPKPNNHKQPTTRKLTMTGAKKGATPQLLKNHPLYKEIAPESQATLKENIVIGSRLKVTWNCQQANHTYQMQIRHRIINKTECPYCRIRKPISGVNDLATLSPHLLKEWSNKNIVEPNQVFNKAQRIVLWECYKGHEWEKSVYSRTVYKTTCPECPAPPKEKNLETEYPEVLKEWAFDLNDRLPNSLTPGSQYKAWWRCTDYGHTWRLSISDRTYYKSGCAICSGRRILKGFNDLETLVPTIAAEWHPTKNHIFPPPSVTSSRSDKNVWWLGKCGHEWKNTIKNRTTLGNGCPYCSNKKVLEGFNDLTTTHPDIASEWHPTRNNELMPKDVVAGSAKEVWWLCLKGHDFRTTVSKRTARGLSCPECSISGTSKIESRFRESFRETLSEVNENHLSKIEVADGSLIQVDIAGGYHNHKIIIEYDGSYWHNKSIENDTRKSLLILEAGYILVRIREDELPHLPITHPNLIQINHKFDAHKEERNTVLEIMKRIKEIVSE